MRHIPEPAVERVTMEQEVKMCQAEEYIPSKQQILKDYEINIQFLNRGCVVRVGCKTIAFEDVATAMNEINAYVCGDTYEVQKRWRELLDM